MSISVHKPEANPVDEVEEGKECDLCEDAPGAVFCPECDDEGQVLCSGCNADMHKPAKMRSHHRVPYAEYRAKHPSEAKQLVEEKRQEGAERQAVTQVQALIRGKHARKLTMNLKAQQ